MVCWAVVSASGLVLVLRTWIQAVVVSHGLQQHRLLRRTFGCGPVRLSQGATIASLEDWLMLVLMRWCVWMVGALGGMPWHVLVGNVLFVLGLLIGLVGEVGRCAMRWALGIVRGLSRGGWVRSACSRELRLEGVLPAECVFGPVGCALRFLVGAA